MVAAALHDPAPYVTFSQLGEAVLLEAALELEHWKDGYRKWACEHTWLRTDAERERWVREAVLRNLILEGARARIEAASTKTKRRGRRGAR